MGDGAPSTETLGASISFLGLRFGGAMHGGASCFSLRTGSPSSISGCANEEPATNGVSTSNEFILDDASINVHCSRPLGFSREAAPPLQLPGDLAMNQGEGDSLDDP
ncbi:UNVERIFIED_CONTAM: hypothetical protein Slati_0892000 [Sesamum latifolium]|uniref:Uncharacterized protein n=1 Tax=Sesamum latifolium TaxID=2727402 RepID=A0AAW2XPL6_9LAMI